MPRKSSNPEGFDQAKYNNAWTSQNMKPISAKFKNDFVDEFKAACKKLGISQADVIRQVAQAVIDKANESRE